MNRATELLQRFRCVGKLYALFEKTVCERHNLTQIEADIIAFLHNNPGRDTASDIVELRMLQKGNVSQAVESLAEKELLCRTPDAADRRKLHLSLTPQAEAIEPEIALAREEFIDQLFFGFSPEEKTLFLQMSGRMLRNASEAIDRRAEK